MNWPPLTKDCSSAIAQVLADVVRERPKDLFEYVAQQLQERSGKDPAQFEAHFEACKRKPRTYTLEEKCPPGQDPLAWVPMRYNDETILQMLRQKASVIIDDIVSADAIDDTRGLMERTIVAFPELMYLQDSPQQERLAFQSIRAIYLACSGCPEIVENLDDADAALAYRCDTLVLAAQTHLRSCALDQDNLHALMVCCLLRVLGDHAEFRARFSGEHPTPELAVLHVLETQPEVLPSFQRLPQLQKDVITATLRAYFPMHMLVPTEVAPVHFAKCKDLLAPIPDGLGFFVSVLFVEHLVLRRNDIVTDEDIDLIRLSTQCLSAVEKYSAARSFELMLKKRAERHTWRLMKDDFVHRAIVRLCCLSGLEDTDSWSEVMQAVEGLEDEERGLLTVELGRKDGITESPVVVLLGGSDLMSSACMSGNIGSQSAVVLMARLLEEASKFFDRSLNTKMTVVHVGDLAEVARMYDQDAPFEDIQFMLEQCGPTEAVVRVS